MNDAQAVPGRREPRRAADGVQHDDEYALADPSPLERFTPADVMWIVGAVLAGGLCARNLWQAWDIQTVLNRLQAAPRLSVDVLAHADPKELAAAVETVPVVALDGCAQAAQSMPPKLHGSKPVALGVEAVWMRTTRLPRRSIFLFGWPWRYTNHSQQLLLRWFDKGLVLTGSQSHGLAVSVPVGEYASHLDAQVRGTEPLAMQHAVHVEPCQPPSWPSWVLDWCLGVKQRALVTDTFSLALGAAVTVVGVLRYVQGRWVMTAHPEHGMQVYKGLAQGVHHVAGQLARAQTRAWGWGSLATCCLGAVVVNHGPYFRRLWAWAIGSGPRPRWRHPEDHMPFMADLQRDRPRINPAQFRDITSLATLDNVDDAPAVHDSVACCVCMEHARCVVLLPCRHLALCAGCARAMLGNPSLHEQQRGKCPLCRADIQDVVCTF